MSTELLEIKLSFRGLSDEDPDEITIDSPDTDEDDDDDDLLDGGDDADAGVGDEPTE